MSTQYGNSPDETTRFHKRGVVGWATIHRVLGLAGMGINGARLASVSIQPGSNQKSLWSVLGLFYRHNMAAYSATRTGGLFGLFDKIKLKT